MQLNQAWPRPAAPRPIVLIGAGGIVNDAHLPAYRKARFPVMGVYDIDPARARDTAGRWSIASVYASLHEALEAGTRAGAVFDVAVPPEFEHAIVEALPDRAVALLQKPMGANLADARRIRDACRRRQIVAAVNFQLRFAPMMLALRDAVDRGLIGQFTDLEVRLNLRTPWELFPFLKKLARVEIQVHTVHYLDMIRSLLGEPRGVYARTLQHPDFTDLASTKSSIILNYGQTTRVCLSVNHNYEFGPEHEAATFSVQGRQGAALITLGLLLNYPQGKPETMQIAGKGQPWQEVSIDGRWFPDGFVGTMSNLQRFAAGEDARLVSGVDDAFATMALVEACYQSDASGGTPISS
jgi:predicted dehydrogenase